jgi:excinuclease ABC subunit B
VYEKDYVTVEVQTAEEEVEYHSLQELRRDIKRLEAEMHKAAKVLAFEEAARLRDEIKELRQLELEIM